jgi:hypothetical protein
LGTVLWVNPAPESATPEDAITPAPPISDPATLLRTVWELRCSAVALAVLAGLLRLAVVFWVQPVAWRLPAGLGLVTMLLGTLLAAGLPVLAYAAHLRRYRRLPRTFLAKPAAFTVPTSPYVGAYLIMGLAIAAGAVATEGVAGGGVDLAPMGWFPAWILVQAVVAVAAWFWVRGPQLALTPDGLVVRGWRSGPAGQTIAWDQVEVDLLPRPSRRAWQTHLPLQDEPDVRLSLGLLWVNPVFLFAAIRRYAERPDRRAAIGTPGELTDLADLAELKRGRHEAPAVPSARAAATRNTETPAAPSTRAAATENTEPAAKNAEVPAPRSGDVAEPQSEDAGATRPGTP